MNRKMSWWKLGAALALLATGAACTDQSGGLRGAAVPQEAATGPDAAADSAAGSVTGAVSDTAAIVDGAAAEGAAADPMAIPTVLPGVREAPSQPQLLRSILADPAYQAALAIVTEDGWSIDTANARVLTAADGKPGQEVRFALKPKAGSRGRWQWLHYNARATGTAPKVFFVTSTDPRATGAELADEASADQAATDADAASSDGAGGAEPLAQGALCKKPGPWGAWQLTGGTYCAGRFICFGNDQVATYQDRERFRQCKKGMQRQVRRDFIKCGCP